MGSERKSKPQYIGFLVIWNRPVVASPPTGVNRAPLPASAKVPPAVSKKKRIIAMFTANTATRTGTDVSGGFRKLRRIPVILAIILPVKTVRIMAAGGKMGTSAERSIGFP